MARASPSASVAVVEAVGARLSGQASRSIATGRWMSASRASGDRLIAGHRHQGNAEALQGLDQPQQLLGGVRSRRRRGPRPPA